MIRFGPSGNSEEFYAQGHKHTFEAMEWLKNMGLNAYEYSFGRGAHIGESAAKLICKKAEENGIALSVHAPYYINLAADSPEKFDANVRYFQEASRGASWLGAKRVVFHPGSPMKQNRNEAFQRVRANLISMLEIMDEMGYAGLQYCPETMGKINQIGNLEEVIELVNIDERVLPTIDFGHLHSRGLGALNTKQDFEDIILRLENGIGKEKTANMHIHFSKIEYTSMGEKQHRTFADEGFGPDFLQLAPVIVEHNLSPTIICESKGTMAKDALAMKKMYLDALKKKEEQLWKK